MKHARLIRRGGIVAFLLSLSVLSSCSPIYVMKAAYQEGKILAGRRDIDTVINDPETSAAEREQLKFVKEARLFSMKMGLTPKNSFTKYTKIEEDVLTWVVVGSKPDSFSLRTWWFPFAGTLPYKGFFTKEEAEAEAKRLEADGYETWVRGSDAFSTLGWFNDPILTPALKQPTAHLVNTVIHETVHATVWINNNVAFNESLANFVGTVSAAQFFDNRLRSCPPSDNACITLSASLLTKAENIRDTEFEIASGVYSLYKRLEKLYSSPLSREEKLTQRRVIFNDEVGKLRAKYPQMKILKDINNAEIVQLVLYLTHLDRFKAQFELCEKSWSCFIEKMRMIEKATEDGDNGIDPFTQLP